jgi:hypothetical protein
MLACSALGVKPSITSASSSGLSFPTSTSWYFYIMVIYWVTIRNVTVEMSLLLEARKFYVGIYHVMITLIISLRCTSHWSSSSAFGFVCSRRFILFFFASGITFGKSSIKLWNVRGHE